MAAATSVTRYIGVLGPMKVEFIQCTMANAGDTVQTSLSGAQWAIAYKNEADQTFLETAISGKTITVTGSSVSNTKPIVLIVVGF